MSNNGLGIKITIGNKNYSIFIRSSELPTNNATIEIALPNEPQNNNENPFTQIFQTMLASSNPIAFAHQMMPMGSVPVTIAPTNNPPANNPPVISANNEVPEYHEEDTEDSEDDNETDFNQQIQNSIVQSMFNSNLYEDQSNSNYWGADGHLNIDLYSSLAILSTI